MNSGRRVALPFFISIVLASLLSLPFVTNDVFADEIIRYELTTQDTSYLMSSDAGHRHYVVEVISDTDSRLSGVSVNNMELKLSKTGSPTGNATIAVWEKSNVDIGSEVYTFGTIDVSTLTTTALWYNFTNFDADYILTTSHAVGIHYVGGAATNRIGLAADAGDPIDGQSSCLKTRTSGTADLSAACAVNQDDLTAVVSLVEPEPLEACPVDSVCFDFDSDGIIDLVVDEEADSIYEVSYSDIPPLVGPVSESAPNLIRALTGLSLDSSILVLGVVIHGIVVFGVAGLFFVKTRQNPPFFVWAFLMVLGGGLSVALAGLPLMYFFIEVALVIGGAAALVKGGVIGN